MKSASTAVCAPQRAPAVGGRVHRRDSSSEVQLYLSKLRRLLPARPGARRLTKLEVIQSVIDYICDLQYCLEMPLEAVDASVKAAVELPAEALSDDRTTTTAACEPAIFGADHDRLSTTPAEVDELELEEEDLMMEEEDLEAEEDAEAEPVAPAPSPAPASQEQAELSASC